MTSEVADIGAGGIDLFTGELVDEEEARSLRQEQTGPEQLRGLTLVKGLASGVAVFHQPRIEIEHVVAEDTEAERQRVYLAFDKMREQIEHISNQAEFGVGGEHEEVLKTYKMFAYDEGWTRRINEAIDSGLTAEAAIERVQQRTRMRMRQIDDSLLADRMHDLEDLANRLLRIVSGQIGTAAKMGLRSDAILIARNLGPAELLEYDRRRLKGVILEEGSLTSHVVIVARAMGIPVLGRVRALRSVVREGDTLLLDSDQATATVRPAPAMIEAFKTRFVKSKARQAGYAKMRDVEPISADGERISLMINAGLRDDMVNLGLTGADGIGLFRTEFQFLVSATLPSRERQTRLYKEVLDAANGRPVKFRTVDIGGDKTLPYLRQHDDGMVEENPAMGWRALRLALEREGLLKVQARALLEAAAGRELNVMFPLISEPWEFDAAKDVFDTQLAFLKKKKKAMPRRLKISLNMWAAFIRRSCQKARWMPVHGAAAWLPVSSTTFRHVKSLLKASCTARKTLSATVWRSSLPKAFLPLRLEPGCPAPGLFCLCFLIDVVTLGLVPRVHAAFPRAEALTRLPDLFVAGLAKPGPGIRQ